jgi:hypothetical protein
MVKGRYDNTQELARPLIVDSKMITQPYPTSSRFFLGVAGSGCQAVTHGPALDKFCPAWVWLVVGLVYRPTDVTTSSRLFQPPREVGESYPAYTMCRQIVRLNTFDVVWVRNIWQGRRRSEAYSMLVLDIRVDLEFSGMAIRPLSLRLVVLFVRKWKFKDLYRAPHAYLVKRP